MIYTKLIQFEIHDLSLRQYILSLTLKNHVKFSVIWNQNLSVIEFQIILDGNTKLQTEKKTLLNSQEPGRYWLFAIIFIFLIYSFHWQILYNVMLQQNGNLLAKTRDIKNVFTLTLRNIYIDIVHRWDKTQWHSLVSA